MGFVDLFYITLISGLIGSSIAARKGGKYCAACYVVVEEIEYEISKVDPKKVLEVDGFRIDPQGNQMKRRTIPYARSETHLTEITEELCERMNQYALSTDKNTGEVKYVLTKSRDGNPVTLENVSMSSQTADELRNLCNAFIEDNDENMVEYFKQKHDDPKNDFCHNIAEVCDSEEEEEEDEDEAKDEL